MAKFGINDADNYGGDTAGYFTLKDDGDSAIVRFMYNSIEDIEGYAVHNITVGDKKKLVNCLRDDYNAPMDECPLCAAKNFQSGKFIFPLYMVETQEVKFWTRGKNILKPLMAVLNNITGPVCGTPIKITRKGAAGDMSTTYTLEALEPDGCTMDDLDTPQDPIGTIIKDYSFEELTNYLKTGNLPDTAPTTSATEFTPRTNNDSNIIRRTYTPQTRNGTGESAF